MIKFSIIIQSILSIIYNTKKLIDKFNKKPARPPWVFSALQLFKGAFREKKCPSLCVLYHICYIFFKNPEFRSQKGSFKKD